MSASYDCIMSSLSQGKAGARVRNVVRGLGFRVKEARVRVWVTVKVRVRVGVQDGV